MNLNKQQQEKLKKLNLHGRINRFLESKGIKYYVEEVFKAKLEDGTTEVRVLILPQHDSDREYNEEELTALLKPEFNKVDKFYVENNYHEETFYEFKKDNELHDGVLRYRSCIYINYDATHVAASTKYGNEWTFKPPFVFENYNTAMLKKGNYVAWKEDDCPYWTYAKMTDAGWFDVALNAPRDSNVRIYNDKDEDFWNKAEIWYSDPVNIGQPIKDLRYMTKDEIKMYNNRYKQIQIQIKECQQKWAEEIFDEIFEKFKK